MRPFIRTSATRQDDRMQRRRHDFDFQASRLEQTADVGACPIHPYLEGRIGRNTGVANILDEFANEIHGRK
jgi:hypothetical protein